MELKDLEQNESNWKLNWMKWNLVSDISVMLGIIYVYTSGSMAVQATVFNYQKSWTMKMLFKHYPVINLWMKLMNVKSVRHVLLIWIKGIARNWNCLMELTPDLLIYPIVNRYPNICNNDTYTSLCYYVNLDFQYIRKYVCLSQIMFNNNYLTHQNKLPMTALHEF